MSFEKCDFSEEKMIEALNYLLQLKPGCKNRIIKENVLPNLVGCSPPDTRTRPEFKMPFNYSIYASCFPGSSEGKQGDLAGVKVLDVELNWGINLIFLQKWTQLNVSIGDLVSTTSLAPSEELEMEFEIIQKNTLDITRNDESESSTEITNTSQNKEIINVHATSIKDRKWNIDGGGGINLGRYKGELKGGLQESINNKTESALEQINDATQKSTYTLKTTHKIEMKAHSEESSRKLIKRHIKNPYSDRSISLNVFQLLKHYSISSYLDKVQPALFIDIKEIEFNKLFVKNHIDFIKNNLLDNDLISQLPLAIQEINININDNSKVVDLAKLALHYLFEDENMFNLPHVLGHTKDPFTDWVDLGDPNNPATSFDASKTPTPAIMAEGNSGFFDAIGQGFSHIFNVLNFIFDMYMEIKDDEEKLNQNAMMLVNSIKAGVEEKWLKAMENPSAQEVRFILDEGGFTEIFRRLSGFLAVIEGGLQPLILEFDEEKESREILQEQEKIWDGLLKHLNSYKNYYIQKFLNHISDKTNNQSIADFVKEIIGITDIGDELKSVLFNVVDMDKAIIDRQTIIIPGIMNLDDYQVTKFSSIFSSAQDIQFDSGNMYRTINEVQVPVDGIHLEVSAGACILENIKAVFEMKNESEFIEG
ncbi:hypothetical protein [Bacillus wiedmannii]|uniref:hypothetical protein n=1 Tax=Bacillus wiedmannii TaxID=1890302 RepID=UPI000BFB5351|nr:hypothetical protein [Bacillus wiedmannii]PHF10033.1 hypothetical protein COF74_08550 [Bacillus wiedmannii]